ncbi:double-strand break repair helicase AddA [Pseudahrensia aquimaris]|uniref:DNA 3'-5' helicase n=1 Tax=Pseudahrensia aquimaris TaxID=744461 RepID=A0ABW3FFF1_9HYPH
MSELFKLIPDETLRQQALASNPDLSAWVSANAGSGKTHVLANRVVRLLLQGVNPSRILALTFTKTAAGEMAKRVFKTLGEWSVMDDDKLREQLVRLQGPDIRPADVLYARTLFARSLETPGGLKIQTIHAFCEALLHQFPLEANVAGNFTVLDPADESALMEEARRWVILRAESGNAPDLADAFAAIMAFASDHAIGNVMDELVSRREEILGWLDAAGGAQQAERATRRAMNVGPDETADDVRRRVLNGLPLSDDEWRSLANTAADNAKQPAGEMRLANNIRAYLGTDNLEDRYRALCAALLKKDGEPFAKGSIVSKRIGDAIPHIRETLLAVAGQLSQGNVLLRTLAQIVETKNLMVLGEAMLKRYRQLKRSRGQLDFNDLIARTADLLLRKEARAWVLYKLDLGIDHVLLDEAQDTSPQQWSIVNALVEEFFAGEGASGPHRTIFAVGDEKQSIYSFQGARPQSFSDQRRLFQKQATGAGKIFQPAKLNLSFRSTPDVLNAVDKVFDEPSNREGLTSDGSYDGHTALRSKAPGCVEIWDRIEGDTLEVPTDWTAPMGDDGKPHQSVQLAEAVAQQIADWIARKELIYPRDTDNQPRPITAGDIIVLVRSRDTFIPALSRALKERAIPVAGTDRLAVTDHIAVKDMIALGNVMLTPQDDLSLAALLRSPLFDVSEDDLMELALNRHDEQTLFESLEMEATRADGPKPAFAQAHRLLTRWMERADAMPVYEFYARILGDDRGRRKLYARLGPEAEDVLDAFLALALKHEQSGLPGLHGFLEALEMGNAELKRELAEGRGEVRVMTVHAAKGQEAPIVFLVDKSSEAYIAQNRPALYRIGSEDDSDPRRAYVWAPSKSDHGAMSAAAEARVKELAEQEYRRLLYVGMTRAEDRLILCGYKSKGRNPMPNWHAMVKEALADDLEEVEGLNPEIPVYRMTSDLKADSSTIVEKKLKSAIPRTALPAWMGHRMPRERALPRPLAPSGAQALIEEHLAQDEAFPSVLEGLEQEESPQAPFARRRGTAIHKLLQVWPDLDAEGRFEKASAYLAAALPEATPVQTDAMLKTIVDVVENPDFAQWFDPRSSRAELPVMGRIDLASGPRPVSGTIDRLAVCDDHVMLLDFKTGTHPPQTVEDVSPDYVTQMALYRALVSRIYPQKPVRAALIWTHAPQGPRLMELPADALDAALAILTAL